MLTNKFIRMVCISGLFAGSPAFAADVAQTLDLAGFDRIDISGVYELDVTVGDDFAIELSGGEKEMDRVEASVRDGTLYLERKKQKKRWSRGTDNGVHAVISMPSLLSLDISGVVDGEVDGIDSERFELEVSGVGDVELSGECGSFEADVSGVGDLNARDLKCSNVDIEVSGVGSATVYASTSVDAEVSGMGNIDVYGSPQDVRKESGLFAEITVH